MKLFHNTYHAEEILRDGFRDGEHALFGLGVWFAADEPLTCQEVAKGNVTLCIEIPDELLRDREVVEEGKPYREFLVLANVVNQYGPPLVVSSEYAGLTREQLENAVRWRREAAGNDPGLAHIAEEANRIIKLIPFLEKHGLMAT